MVKRLHEFTVSKRKKLPTVEFHYNMLKQPIGVTCATVHHLGKSYLLTKKDIDKAILFYIEENLQ